MNSYLAQSLLVLALLLAGACQPKQSENQLPENQQSASSPNGMVVTAHPLATAAGTAILEKGGNAIDAAVAAGFALAVVEPTMSGLGGRLQAIVRTNDGVVNGYDATTQAPLTYDQSTATKAAYGYPTIGVPGVVKGLITLLNEQGTLTLADVMGPAIRLAEEGYDVLPGESMRRAGAIKTIRKFKGTSQYFLNEDTIHLAGERFIQKDLATTLKLIRDGGADVFYKGELAKKIVADISANGGYLDSISLASYTVNKSMIVKGDYRGHELNGLWMPSYGAIVIEMLQIMENFPLDEVSEAEWGRIVYKANQLAYDDRDAQESEENARQLTDKAYAKKLADMIVEETLPKAAHLKTEQIPESWMALGGHTTHLSVADKNGNVIALTQSLGPNMGSKVVTPGLGFLYASTMGGYLGDIQPGQRASSHIAPFIVTKDGQPYLVLGAAGGGMIVTAVAQAISRFIDRDMELPLALAAGRVHASDSSMLVETHLGTSWTRDDITQFKSWGLPVKEIERPASFGRVHGIYYDAKSKTWYGAADPDWEGTAGAPTK